MPQVLCAVLQPASGGFGEWGWIEAVEAECCETLSDYEELLNSGPQSVDYERTTELDGRIHNQRGVVYRFEGEIDPEGNPQHHYEMVWVDAEEL